MTQYTRPREIRVTLDIPAGWDIEDFEYLMERLSYALARELGKGAFTIEEIIK